MIKDDNINCTVEALILASSEPVSIRRLCDVIDDITAARVRQAVDDLNNVYLGCGSSFRIRELAGGYQFYILPDFEQPVRRLLTKEKTIRLTRPALETLSIIAYKQPVTKTDIEHIRGVASDGVLHNLLQRKLIAIAGRSDSPGRPLLYKTSPDFLKFFGLNRISDLPRMDEIEEMIRQADGPKEQTAFSFDRDDESTPESSDEYTDETAETDPEQTEMPIPREITPAPKTTEKSLIPPMAMGEPIAPPINIPKPRERVARATTGFSRVNQLPESFVDISTEGNIPVPPMADFNGVGPKKTKISNYEAAMQGIAFDPFDIYDPIPDEPLKLTFMRPPDQARKLVDVENDADIDDDVLPAESEDDGSDSPNANFAADMGSDDSHEPPIG